MPVKKVTKDGKIGYRYGDTGKLYFGKDAKKKAILQSKAIHASQNRNKK